MEDFFKSDPTPEVIKCSHPPVLRYCLYFLFDKVVARCVASLVHLSKST
jgi:hypothetical protein